MTVLTLGTTEACILSVDSRDIAAVDFYAIDDDSYINVLFRTATTLKVIIGLTEIVATYSGPTFRIEWTWDDAAWETFESWLDAAGYYNPAEVQT